MTNSYQRQKEKLDEIRAILEKCKQAYHKGEPIDPFELARALELSKR